MNEWPNERTNDLTNERTNERTNEYFISQHRYINVDNTRKTGVPHRTLVGHILQSRQTDWRCIITRGKQKKTNSMRCTKDSTTQMNKHQSLHKSTRGNQHSQECRNPPQECLLCLVVSRTHGGTFLCEVWWSYCCIGFWDIVRKNRQTHKWRWTPNPRVCRRRTQ